MIYMDSAATTLQKPGSVGAVMQRAVSSLSSPGRGGHRAAMRAAETAFKTREAAAALFNLPNPENVIFCMNATHALNIAINSIVPSCGRVVVSGYEHNSVIRPLYAIGAEVYVARSALFDVQETLNVFDRSLTKSTKAAVVNHCSNVFGYILPIREISRMCYERGIPLIIDASQSAGAVSIDFEALNAVFIAMPGHKGLYGPQGTGLLLCSGEAKAYMYGGSGSNSRLLTMPDALPDKLEAGTHNMPGIAGLYEGIKFVTNRGPATILRHERALLRQAVNGLSGIAGLELYYSRDESLQSGVLSFRAREIDSELFAERLSARGIAVRAGLHCAPVAHETAGTFDTGTVRLSFSAFNTQLEVSRMLVAVREIMRKGT